MSKADWLTGDSKLTPISSLQAEKIAEALLLYVFNNAFPESLLQKFVYLWTVLFTTNLIKHFCKEKTAVPLRVIR